MSRSHATTAIPARAATARATAVVVGLAALAAGCAAAERQTPDDTLVVVLEQAVRTADPRYTLSSYDSKLSRLIAPGLTSVDTPTGEPRLLLASAIERVDDVTWDVLVRPDARFPDGSPVTSADVAFSFQSMLDEGSDSVYHKTYLERFRRVEAVTPERARFHLQKPTATFLTDLDHGILSVRAAGPGGRFRGGLPVGAGAYQLVELTGTGARLVANPHYVLGPAKLAKLELRFVRDQAARILMLVGGSADLAQNAVRLDLIDDVVTQPRVDVDSGPSQILTYLMFNNEDPILARKEVRQAIASAIDRPSIVAAKFSGRAQLASGILPPQSPFHEAQVPRWAYDPARARQLLDAAGFPDPDGPGPAPRFSLTYKTSADTFRVSVARVIAAQLAEVGIAVEVRSFEFATFFSDIKKGQFQLASMQTTEIGNPDYHYTYFHSARIPTAKDPDANNRWRYRNRRVDELCQAGRDELDAAKRKVHYSEVQRIVADELPIVPLWHEDVVVLHHPKVTGFTITPNARFGGFWAVTK